jgi:hypothetical protein
VNDGDAAAAFARVSGFASSPQYQSDSPSPLKREVRQAAPFPVKALGPVLAPAAQAIAAMVQAPLAIAGSSVLATASLVCAPHGDVLLPFGAVRPISLFIMTVAESGDRKSAADEKALNAFDRHERNGMENYLAVKQLYDNELMAWNAERLKVTRNKRLSLQEVTVALNNLGPKPLPPLHPTRRSGDPTVQGLQIHLVDAHPSFGLFTSEGGQFIGGYGLSQAAKIHTAGILNNFWDGVPNTRIRASNEERIYLIGRRVSLHILVQPTIAGAFINDRVLADQGFMSRFLCCAPDSIAGDRPFRDPEREDIDTLITYGKRIERILAIEPKVKPDTRNVLDPPVIDMAGEAKRLWIAFYDENEKLQGKGVLNALTKAFANKLPEQAARIAAILATVRTLSQSADGEGQLQLNKLEITAADMAGGIELARYYVNEELRFVEKGLPDPQIDDAEVVLEWLRARATKVKADGGGKAAALLVTLAEVYRKGPRRVRRVAEAKRIMNVLLNHGHVQRAKNSVLFEGHFYKEAFILQEE